MALHREVSHGVWWTERCAMGTDCPAAAASQAEPARRSAADRGSPVLRGRPLDPLDRSPTEGAAAAVRQFEHLRRRLQEWDENGTLPTLWRAFLAELDSRDKVCWDQCFGGGSFAPAKGGRQRREDQARKGYEVDASGRWRGYSAGSSPGLGQSERDQAARADARHGRGKPDPQARPSAAVPRAADSRPGLRQQRPARLARPTRPTRTGRAT
jgi:hypothetical protein